MFWYQAYLLFALTTAIAAILELYSPTIKAHEDLIGKPIKDRRKTYVIFFITSFIIAPLIFFSCIIPSMGERFRLVLAATLFSKDK